MKIAKLTATVLCKTENCKKLCKKLKFFVEECHIYVTVYFLAENNLEKVTNMNIPSQCNRNKKLYIDQNFIDSLREACNWKKAERLPENSYYDLYVGEAILRDMESPDNQIIWGRRGTGKTHLLKAFVQKINNEATNKKIALYISCDQVKVQSPIDIKFSSDTEKIKHLAREAYISFLTALVEQLIDNYQNILKNKYAYYDIFEHNQKRSQFQKTADARLMDLYENCTHGVPTFVKKKKTTIDKSKKEKQHKKEASIGFENKLTFHLNDLFSLKGKLSRKKTKQKIDSNQEEIITIETYRFDFSKARETLKQLLATLQIDTLYICIDELWLIDQKRDLSIQPLFLDYIRQTFLCLGNISIKIASIREVTKLNSKALATNSYGLQSGHDINELVNLDTQFLKEKDIIKQYEKILHARINYFSKNEDKYNTQYIIEAIFKNNTNLKSLILLTHLIPRNFLNVLQRSLTYIQYDLHKYFVHSYLIRQVVIKTFLEEKRSNLPMNAGSLFSVINQYINNTQNYFFLLSTEQTKRLKPEIDNLVYIEMIHQIPSSSLPIDIMDSFKGFYIDSGKYFYTLSVNNSINNENEYNFSYVLPESLNSNYKKFVINLDTVESEFIECVNCCTRVSKKHPVYEKAKICPICAFKF